MRLIDADEIGKEIAGFFMAITGNPKPTTVVRECRKSFERMIDEQPTAFNLEKVVGQLQEYADDSAIYAVKGAWESAIEIVKKGGTT